MARMQLRGRSMWRPGVRAERRPRRTVSSSRLLRVHAPRDLGRDRRALPRLQRLRPGRRQERLRLLFKPAAERLQTKEGVERRADDDALRDDAPDLAAACMHLYSMLSFVRPLFEVT